MSACLSICQSVIVLYFSGGKPISLFSSLFSSVFSLVPLLPFLLPSTNLFLYPLVFYSFCSSIIIIIITQIKSISAGGAACNCAAISMCTYCNSVVRSFGGSVILCFVDVLFLVLSRSIWCSLRCCCGCCWWCDVMVMWCDRYGVAPAVQMIDRSIIILHVVLS